MDSKDLDDIRYRLYNSMCNVRDDNGDYLFDEDWIKNKFLGDDEKENPDDN